MNLKERIKILCKEKGIIKSIHFNTDKTVKSIDFL